MYVWLCKNSILPFVVHPGENSHKYGEQRMWGAFGWGTMSIVAGLVVDWYSQGQNTKNYTPSFLIATVFQVLDAYVLSRIEVSINL